MALQLALVALVALELGFGGFGGSQVAFGGSTGGLRWPWWHLSWALVALVALKSALVALQVAFGGS